MDAATLVKSARTAARLDQSALAARARSSQSQISLIEAGRQSPTFDTLARVLRSAGRQLIAVETLRDDAATIASEIARALADSADARALRLFIQLSDNLAAEHGATRFALGLAEPPTTGSTRWDVAIAALVAHWLREEALPVPEWADSRSLSRTWNFADLRLRPDRAAVPPEFLRRRVLIDRDTLASV
jgi:transcriptional regulator with XRE-family HTH domain